MAVPYSKNWSKRFLCAAAGWSGTDSRGAVRASDGFGANSHAIPSFRVIRGLWRRICVDYDVMPLVGLRTAAADGAVKNGDCVVDTECITGNGTRPILSA